MIERQQQLGLSPYGDLYEIVVPKDNLLRQLKDMVDFTFVYEEVVSNYTLDNGRTAKDPIRMFKYLLLKVIYDLSDVRVVERSLYDLSFKYFLDMVPEDRTLIDPSTLTYFRKLRLKDVKLMNLLLSKTIEIAKEKGIRFGKNIIVDATHTIARSVNMHPKDALMKRVKALEKSLRSSGDELGIMVPKTPPMDDVSQMLAFCKDMLEFAKSQELLMLLPEVKEKAELLTEAIDDTEERFTVSKDKDARVGYKTPTKPFFGTKEHIALDEESGLVTAVVVTSGEANDGKQLGALVRQSRENGMEVEGIIADTAYAGTPNQELAAKSKEEGGDFKLYARMQREEAGHSEDDGFVFNKDAGMMVCPAGHMAIGKCYRKAFYSKDRGRRNGSFIYRFNVEICRNCPLKEGCYNGTKTKCYTVSIPPELNVKHREFEKTDEFKQKLRQRYQIEAKNSDLKNNYGLDRAASYGLENMTMQTALSVFACNLKRIIRLTNA